MSTPSMTPIPRAQSPSTVRSILARARRTRNANPYESSRNLTPTHIPAPTPVAPLDDSDEEEEEEEEEGEEGEDADDDDLDDNDDDELSDEEAGGDLDVDDIDIDIENVEEGGVEEVPMEIDPPFDPTALGLKEIGNLASWTVSSCKPGCGVEALRDDNTDLFWQSDGPQPHHLNIHFSRLVSIRSIRLYLDFISDESYTPTRITILAGTGYHDLLPFSVLEFAQPKGWIDVPLEHVGGGEDGKTLRAFLVQVKVVENHQNGKDTHLRGLKVYAKDEKLGRSGLSMLPEKERHPSRTPTQKKTQSLERDWLIEPDWMGEPELR